jgi:hypothetical protein
MATFTLAQIGQIVGKANLADVREFTTEGKWLVCDQYQSAGVMASWVSRCKAAGLPAFFNASERKFGVLNEQVQA